jgi:uncharacterized membrane protein YphA (DoxX/SURF4 family)
MRIDGAGQGLLVVAIAAVGILSLCYGDVVPLGQPLPGWIPWRPLWLYGSACLLLACSVGLCVPRLAPASAVTIAGYGLVRSLICGVAIVAEPRSVSAWYPFCEALAPLVSGWLLYALLSWQSRRAPTGMTGEAAVRVAQALFGLTCIFYGWSHFKYADYTAGMVPVWLPAHRVFAYLTGAGHVAAGIGIVVGVFARLAATLEAIMMSLFGLLVWVPSFFVQPRPDWATPAANQWSELVVTLVVATAAWLVASSLRYRPWLR